MVFNEFLSLTNYCTPNRFDVGGDYVHKNIIAPRVLDRLEQIIIVLLWIWMAQRMLQSENPLAPLLLISEASVAFFVLIRRPTDQISMKWSDWSLALIATGLPMLVTTDTTGSIFPAVAVALILAGNIWQIGAKLFLRRSFGVAPANRGVKISGPYRFMRHPIYAGYLITHIGALMLLPSLWNLALYALAWWVQILRLLAEERLLSLDLEYQNYRQRVRYRLIPGIY